MAEKIVSSFLTNPQLGLSAVFLALFLLIFYYMRKDAKEHRDEYKEVVHNMFNVVRRIPSQTQSFRTVFQT